MAVNIWPSANDVAAVAGNGSKLLEQRISGLVKLITDENVVFSGLLLTVSSGLNVNVTSGIAYIDGHFVEYDSTTGLSLTANQTNFIWAQLTYDVGGNVDGATFLVNTSGTPSGETVYLGAAITNGSGVSSFSDLRIASSTNPFIRQTTLNALIPFTDYTQFMNFAVGAGNTGGGIFGPFGSSSVNDFVQVSTRGLGGQLIWSAQVVSSNNIQILYHNVNTVTETVNGNITLRVFSG